jgi:hypothetical protein
MPTVVAEAVRRGCAFSSDAAARVVGDVGRQTLRPVAALRLPCRNDRTGAPFRRRGTRLSVMDAVTCS